MSDESDDPEFGSDSFLDVVANIVGILIILVVIVGLRAGATPPELPPEAEAAVESIEEEEPVPQPAAPAVPEPPPIDLDTPRRKLQMEREAVLALLQEQRNLMSVAAVRQAEREQVVLAVAAKKALLAEKEKGLTDEERAFFDLTKALETSKNRLDDLDKEMLKATDVSTEVVQIQHDSTPLSRTVYGDEVHFRLSGGKVSFVPVRELLELVRDDLDRQKWRVREGDPIECEVGPVDQFRMKYRLEVRQLSQVGVTARRDVPVGSVIQVTRWELLVEDGPLVGESEATAVAAGSGFRRALERHPPGRTTVTLWVYPDSFPLFRRLKAELTALRYPCAGRPLPEDMAIAGSPFGSRSSAQ